MNHMRAGIPNETRLLLPFFQAYCSSPSPDTQFLTSSSDTPELKRIPSCQSPPPAFSSRSSPLSPKPELAEVQNGITVFPAKSFVSTKLSTGHAAIPHHMGYPINTVSFTSQSSTSTDTSSTFRCSSFSCSLLTRLSALV